MADRIKKQGTFNRRREQEKQDWAVEGISMGEEPAPPLPKATGPASKPALYPAFARGVNSVGRKQDWGPDTLAGGVEMQDVNNKPGVPVATSGATRPKK